VLFFLVVIAGGTLGLYVHDVGWDQAWAPAQQWIDDYQAGREARRLAEAGKTVNSTDPTKRVVEMSEMDLRPLYQQDPRWDKALTMGDEGVAQFEAAVKVHYDPNAEGDPFRFRAETTEALEKIDKAVAMLQQMQEDLADNKSAQVAIDVELRRYEKTLGSLGPKAHRR